MTFFTAEDFQVGGINADNYDDMAATLANQKLQREAKVVYGLKSTKLGDEFYFSEHKDDADTHRALLICIEEIERPKCEHDCQGSSPSNNRYFCFKCGKEIKPTGWEMVE